MASDVSIAMRIEAAIKTLGESMLIVSDLVGVTPIEIPRHARGGERMLEAVQLEAMVAWMGDLLTALSPSPLASDESVNFAPKAKRGRPAKGS
jgi:hypothetical protein